MSILQWLQENTAFVSMVTGIVTALIWLVYLQLMFTSQRRQKRAILSLDRGAGHGMNGRIILTNLGFEPVYVTDILAVLHKGGEQFSANITERDEVSHADLETPLSATLQGPLASGEYRDLGAIQNIFERIRVQEGMADLRELDRFELMVLARRERATGARRTYRIVYHEGEPYLDADTMDTRRLAPRRVNALRRNLGYDVPHMQLGRSVASPT